MAQANNLLSAPGEGLEEHLERVLAKWDEIKHRFGAALPRLFGSPWEEIDRAVRRMLLLHDLGKATEKWQPDDPDSWKDNDPYLCPFCKNHKEIKAKNKTPAQALLDHLESEHKDLRKQKKDNGNDQGEKGVRGWSLETVKIPGDGEKRFLVVDGLRRPREQRPPHAQIGAAYLWRAFGEEDEDLVMASAFAIAIHHTDSALARPGVEDPATLLVQKGLVNEADDRIMWHEGLGDFVDWLRQEHGLNAPDPMNMTVYDVAEFALRLRRWARGTKLLELHRRRLQVAALHSVIKVCDIRAAAQRSEEPVPVNTFTWTILNGGLLPWER